MKKFTPSPSDSFVVWTWDTGELILNSRYYFTGMSKANQTKLDRMMKKLNATIHSKGVNS